MTPGLQRQSFGRLGTIGVALALACAYAGALPLLVAQTGEPAGYTVLDRTMVGDYPQDVAALRDMESKVIEVAEKAMPFVIKVGQGSGVIIDADGLILSQWHVTHKDPARGPGDRIRVVFRGGEERSAELLGADIFNDISLLRLIEPGPYPFISIAERADVQLGDPVIKFGYPVSGGRPSRAPVVRLGRVVCAGEDSIRKHGFFVADCFVNGGDSGGPLFDLDGRLVAIIRASAMPHIVRPNFGGVRPRHRSVFSYTTSARVREVLPKMLEGKVLPDRPPQRREEYSCLRSTTQVPPDCWTQGSYTCRAYGNATKKVGQSVVEIRDGDGKAVSLGFVVGDDGWLMTRSATLPLYPVCVLPDGRELVAEIVGVSSKLNIAMLKVQAIGLQAISWGEPVDLPVGTLVAIPGSAANTVAAGVVSVSNPDATFEHDAGLLPHEYGGPIVDLSGRVVGVSISPLVYGSIALSVEEVRASVPELKSGRLRPKIGIPKGLAP